MKQRKTPVDMALQWLWNKSEISTVLSGMTTMKQVQQNIESAKVSGIDTLTQDDLGLLARVYDKYKKFNAIPCTKCGYCMPCPNGVDIPRNFELYNEGMSYNELGLCRNLYNWHLRQSEWASACIACNVCEEKCPQQIPISEWMPKIHETLVFQS